MRTGLIEDSFLGQCGVSRWVNGKVNKTRRGPNGRPVGTRTLVAGGGTKETESVQWEWWEATQERAAPRKQNVSQEEKEWLASFPDAPCFSQLCNYTRCCLCQEFASSPNHPFKPSLHLILLEAFLSCPEVGNDPITFCLYFFLQVPSYLAIMYQLLSFSVDDGELFYGNQWSLNHYIHP